MKFQFVIAPITLSLVFFSCKKEVSLIHDTIKKPETSKNAIESWLTQQADKRTDEAKSRILNLKDNLLLDAISVEKVSQHESFWVIPIAKNYKSLNNKAKPVSPYLLISFNDEAGIKGGTIIHYLADSIPTTTLNFYNSIYKENTFSGRITYLSISDKFLCETKLVNGKAKSFSNISAKSSENRNTQDCIDWYLITYNINPDGTFYTTEQFIGRTCGGSECLNVQCEFVENPGSPGSGEVVDRVITSETAYTENETDYVEQDLENNTGFSPVIYTYNTSISWLESTGQIVSVIVHPVTASPMIGFYIDSYGRSVTRRLTLLNQMNGYTYLSASSILVYWSCSVNGLYTYIDGSPPWTRQWNKSKQKVY